MLKRYILKTKLHKNCEYYITQIGIVSQTFISLNQFSHINNFLIKFGEGFKLCVQGNEFQQISYHYNVNL